MRRRFGVRGLTASEQALKHKEFRGSRARFLVSFSPRRWLRRLPGRRAPQIDVRYSALAAAAARIRERTEPEFLQLSEDLRELHENAGAMSRTIREQVSAVRDVLGGNRLAGAGGLAEQALEELHSGLDEGGGLARALQKSREAMGRLRGCGRQMRRVASLLEVSGYGFAVESARSADSLRAFDSFVTELRNLAARVGVLGDTIAQQAELARAESERLETVMRADLAGLIDLTAAAELAVRQTSQRAQSALDASWTALQEAQRHTTRIASFTEDAVYHLQFGDIARQKLEHIEATLLETGPEIRYHVLSLQAGQLDLVSEEISSSHRQLEQAFAGLAGETRQLALIAQRFVDSGNPAHQGDPIQELRSALLQIEQLRIEGRRICQDAADTAARARETAGHLSRYVAEVEDINLRIHLQALNAIVKTALLGDAGRTLEILSMHVQRVFEESSELVAGTVELIGAIAADAATGAAAGSGEDTRAALADGVDQLASIRDQFHRAMDSSAVQAAEQESRLERARLSLAFLDETEKDVSALAAEIAEVQRELASLPGAVTDPADAEALHSRYTVASEREVHRRVTGSAGPALPSASPAMEAETASAAQDDNIALFLDRPAPPSTQVAEDDLGDNVELF